jgi:hypothetical protein
MYSWGTAAPAVNPAGGGPMEALFYRGESRDAILNLESR